MTTELALPTPRLEPPEAPPELEPARFAERLYVSMAPLTGQEPSYGWALLILCNTIGVMFELLEELERDTGDGPGWSALMDLDRCPPIALPWLGQFVGVRVLPGTTATEQRARIASTDGFHRGTPAAIRAAMQATLTGTKTVTIRERDGDPYHLTVSTLETETPDVPATRAALYSQKPAGLTVTFEGGAAAQTWGELRAAYATWGDLRTRYDDWLAAMLDEPA